MSEGYVETIEPPQEVYDKFDEFLALLLELNNVRDTLYMPINQRIAATLDMISEEKGMKIRDDFVDIRVSLRFDETDFNKVLERCITYRWRGDMSKYTERAVMLLSGWCDELRAAKEPEPEVLIVKDVPGPGDHRRKGYWISSEWMNWCRRALPHFPPEAPWEMGALHAIKKYFKKKPEDRIEYVFAVNPFDLSQDAPVSFYRVTREKL